MARFPPNRRGRGFEVTGTTLPPIVDVWQMLGGGKLRRFGKELRGQRFWCNGDGWSVALNPAKDVWRDYVANRGGGVLDLVVEVRGGIRADAARWLNPSQPWDRSKKRQWAHRRTAAELLAERAADWQRGVWLTLEAEKQRAFNASDDTALEIAAAALYRLETVLPVMALDWFNRDSSAGEFERIGREDREHIDTIAYLAAGIIAAAQSTVAA